METNGFQFYAIATWTSTVALPVSHSGFMSRRPSHDFRVTGTTELIK